MKGFNDKQLTTIIRSIMTMEFQEHNLDYKAVTGTVKLYKNIINMSSNYSNEEKQEFLKRITPDTIAYHTDESNVIIVFIDRIKKYKTLEKQLFVTVFTCFHEVRHAIQKYFDEFSYDKFISDIEYLYTKDNKDHYVKNHNNYSYEIGADLYAITKTIDFFKKKNPEVYEKEKLFMEGMKARTLDSYYLYDATYFVSNVINKILKTKIVPDNNVLKIFFNENGEIKSLDEIVKDVNYKKLDKRIVYYILSSIPSLEEKSDKIGLLLESNRYVSNIIENQEKYKVKRRKMGIEL